MVQRIRRSKADRTGPDARTKAQLLTEPPMGPQKTRAEIISEFAAEYTKLKPTLPQGEVIEKEILDMAGALDVHGDPQFNYTLVAVSLDSPHISIVGSSCGNGPADARELFSNKSLVTFLRNRGVTHIFGVVVGEMLDTAETRHLMAMVNPAIEALCAPGYPKPSEPEPEVTAIKLSGIALPIVGRDGHIFEGLVRRSHGSFRYEHSQVPDWSVYESE
ncbi:MAG: hypothetical protein PHF60_01680 [Candidatus ainarchaeum sp.]|nr:hypothetical protein [Candidatus ainarchaeum sp.]